MSAVKTSLAIARSPAPAPPGVSGPDWPAPGSLAAPAERASFGKAARGLVPRDGHAALELPFDRPDPVDLLEMQARSRLPELVPVRYGRMLISPFAYFRGSAVAMASDLAGTPVTGFTVQACGDAHLGNFGVFRCPQGGLVFDISDFDETLASPWEWDVKRLAASLEIAARDNGFTGRQRRAIVTAAVARYREAMRQFADQNNLGVWYARAELDQLRRDFAAELNARQRKLVDKGMATAQTRDSMQALAKLTTVEDGQLRIKADPPLVVPIDDLVPAETDRQVLEQELAEIFDGYKKTLSTELRFLLDQYKIIDMARKVVGVGSVGTRCWIVLMMGQDRADPLFLQVKEAPKSALSGYAGASRYTNQGQRVVAGQRLMQAYGDIFLGWHRVSGLDGQTRDFYIRQLKDWKFSLDVQAMVPRGMRSYAELCGWTLARAHARSGDRIAIASYLGRSDVIDQAIADFAAAYADQNQRDHEALLSAVASGRIAADQGV
jgi:uncharacterized protein (DUF2252 family)